MLSIISGYIDSYEPIIIIASDIYQYNVRYWNKRCKQIIFISPCLAFVHFVWYSWVSTRQIQTRSLSRIAIHLRRYPALCRSVTVIFKKIGSRRRCVINVRLTLQICRPRQAAASALADIFIVIIFPSLFHAKLIKIAPAAFWIIYEIRDGNTMAKH